MSNTGNQTTTDGWVLSGFGGTVAPTLGNTSSTATGPVNPSPGFLTGVFFGFSDDSKTSGEADLVMRYRDTTGMTSADQTLVSNAVAGQTYLIVAEVNVNGMSPIDPVTYWVNPTDLSSVGGLNGSTSIQGTVNTYSFQGSSTGNGDFTRLNYAAYDYTGDAFFDEARLGTTLASIAPAATVVPEPTSLVLTALGGLSALGAFRRRRPAR